MQQELHPMALKPGFHYPSLQPELKGDRFPLPVNTGRVDGCVFPLAELSWLVMETGHPSTRAVNSGSENRALVTLPAVATYSCEFSIT